MNNFHWERKGLFFDGKLIIPHGEIWINNVQNLRMTSLIRKDRPWEITRDRELNINFNIDVY